MSTEKMGNRIGKYFRFLLFCYQGCVDHIDRVGLNFQPSTIHPSVVRCTMAHNFQYISHNQLKILSPLRCINSTESRCDITSQLGLGGDQVSHQEN